MGQDQNTDQKLVQYLLANQDSYEYLVAVSSSNSASSLILATGQPVMSLGGFTGSDKIITSTAQLQQLIANHTVRYFLTGGNMGGGGGQNSVVTQYVENTCQAVDSSLYSSSTATSTAGASQTGATGSSSSSNSPGGFGGQQSAQLYMCGS
jgi:4-amino-4-deoxy-L-arabinose transferase-like glycosyltransferase